MTSTTSMMCTSAALTRKARLIDEDIVAPIGVDRILGRPVKMDKASFTNNQLMFQGATEEIKKQTAERVEKMTALGKYPRNGNLEDISLLAMIHKRLKALHAKGGITSEEAANNAFIKLLVASKHSAEATPFHTSDIKKLFPIAESNHCTNFGSFGCPPNCVALCQNLYQQFIVDSDADNFYRNEIFPRLHDVRRALADYINLEDEDELFLTDNAGEAMNVLLSSLMFNPLYLKYQLKLKNERLGINSSRNINTSTTTSSAPPVFKILMFTNAYPMVQECADFHMNRLRALAEFNNFSNDNSASNNLPYSIEIEKIVLTREMVESLKEIPVNPKTNYFDFSAAAKPTSSTSTSPLFISTVVNKVLNENFSCLIIDHIMFSPALIVPIDEITRQIKKSAPETLILIDGAHAIGQIRLDFSQHGSTMGRGSTKEPITNRNECIDGFLSNCHKWLGAPKSSAILYVRKELHCFLHPTVVSNQHRGDNAAFQKVASTSASENTTTTTTSVEPSRGGRFGFSTDTTENQKLHSEFVWKGTRDATQFLCIPDLIWLRKQFGDERWQQENRKLVLEGAKKMAEVWKTEDGNPAEILLDDCTSAVPCMICVKLPCEDMSINVEAMKISVMNFTNFIAFAYFEGKPWVRVGAQIYNTVEDFEYSAVKFLEALNIQKKIVESQK